MIKNLKKFKTAQSIIEYICVAMVFMTVGVATFIASTRTAATVLRGERETFRSQNTMMGKTLDGNVSQEAYEWPSTWGTQAATTDNYEEAVSGGQIADASGTTVGQPRSELYKYESLNWSIYHDVPYDNGLNSGGQTNGQ